MKNQSRSSFLVGCVFALFGLNQVYASNFYVATDGNDNNDGLSLGSPLKTINQALQLARNSGDQVYVRAGTYAETLYIDQNGISLSAYPDEKPVIDGGQTLPDENWGALISIPGNYNSVSGFEVRNSNTTGKYLGGYGVEIEGHHNVVSHMDVHHIWETGILAEGDYNTVEDSRIWQSSRAYINTTLKKGWASGMSAARNRSRKALKKGITSYPILRRNIVFNNYGEGLSCYEADHCTLEDNIVYDNWTVNLYLSDATNSLVQRNLVYVSSNPAIAMRSAYHPGIVLADELRKVPRSANNTIINNLLYNADLSAFSWTLVAKSGLRNVLIANNTVVDGSFFSSGEKHSGIVNKNSFIINNIFSGSESEVTNNKGLVFSNNNWQTSPAFAESPSDVAGDPKITRTGSIEPGAVTAEYFKIAADSPVIDAALPLENVAEDYFGAERGTAPDIGAHEFQ